MHASSTSGPSAGNLDTLEEGEEDEEDTSVRLQKAMASHADPPADDREALTRLYTRIAPEKLGNIDGHVDFPGYCALSTQVSRFSFALPRICCLPCCKGLIRTTRTTRITHTTLH